MMTHRAKDSALRKWGRVARSPAMRFPTILLGGVLLARAAFGAASFLCVIKDCGDEGDGLLSFPMRGTSVALDMPVRDDTQRVVDTLEQRPAQTVIASMLTVLLSPVLIIVMLITVIGIALVPFLGLGLLCAGLFGKAAVLATLGDRKSVV